MAHTNLEFTSARVVPAQGSQIGSNKKDNSSKFIRMDRDPTRNALAHNALGYPLNI